MKFKKGDKVRIISNVSMHHFKIGEVVTIKSIDNEYYLAYGDSWHWYINDSECEPANNTIKLKLKQL